MFGGARISAPKLRRPHHSLNCHGNGLYMVPMNCWTLRTCCEWHLNCSEATGAKVQVALTVSWGDEGSILPDRFRI